MARTSLVSFRWGGMSGRTRSGSAAERDGRLRKARQFADVAAIVFDYRSDAPAEIGDVYVTLCVHAGIAATDVICIDRLGRYSVGEDHVQAVALLEQASSKTAGSALRSLLQLKTKAGYSHSPVSRAEALKASRALEVLLIEARA